MGKRRWRCEEGAKGASSSRLCERRRESRAVSCSRQLGFAPARFTCIGVSPESTESLTSAAWNFCRGHQAETGSRA